VRVPEYPSAFTVTLSGNVTGTGNTGTSINTTIPFIAANNQSGYSAVNTHGGFDSTVIGWGATTGDIYSYLPDMHSMTVVGTNAHAQTLGGTAFGANASAGVGSMAIGWGALANPPYNAMAIGTDSLASAIGSMAVGSNAGALGDYSIAFGGSSSATTTKAVALGFNSGLQPGSLHIGGHQGAVTTVISTLKRTTTDGFPIQLVITSPENDHFSTLQNAVYLFTVQVTGSDNTDFYAAKLEFLVHVDYISANSIIGTPIKTIIAQTSGASTWDVNPSTTVSYGWTEIMATGETGKTIKWGGTATITAFQTV
jgi:hypothetical protein